ncbi:uncharacterized protein LAESUDRAFT_471647 [Laetiporus sulphureus 93-53]|uniref:Uncharacterized protein n=1 Tax=Laetiporus sulphureus 93-53 TaxID=1314785 RepID=A0A165GAP3_9APHY|nr:uncharacterized protein LAESUDRAFT_471647 [Laetiporus sulphureus 93-53]KZT10079.1 hypothetical protein LAESUDRAFT_471647 [Laetiporus sulphureus 93-53]
MASNDIAMDLEILFGPPPAQPQAPAPSAIPSVPIGTDDPPALQALAQAVNAINGLAGTQITFAANQASIQAVLGNLGMFLQGAALASGTTTSSAIRFKDPHTFNGTLVAVETFLTDLQMPCTSLVANSCQTFDVSAVMLRMLSLGIIGIVDYHLNAAYDKLAIMWYIPPYCPENIIEKSSMIPAVDPPIGLILMLTQMVSGQKSPTPPSVDPPFRLILMLAKKVIDANAVVKVHPEEFIEIKDKSKGRRRRRRTLRSRTMTRSTRTRMKSKRRAGSTDAVA